MKTIGFVDYYLSEWHANNYPAWIKEENEKLGEDFEVKYAWGEIDSLEDGKSNEQWCKDFGVIQCASIEELCEKADYIIILAPSNPEKHLEYAEKVFAYKKRTYVDKTFAPDYKTAKAIFDVAEKYGTPFFSSSALRFATELDDLVDVQSLFVTGGGRSLEEYCIHQVEMLVKVLGEKPLKCKVEHRGQNQYIVSIQLTNEKMATMAYSNGMPFSVCAMGKDGKPVYKKIESSFFKLLLSDILKFFATGKIPFDTKQTLDVIKIREGIVAGLVKDSQWIEL